jgi:hypothetical protein
VDTDATKGNHLPFATDLFLQSPAYGSQSTTLAWAKAQLQHAGIGQHLPVIFLSTELILWIVV